MIEHKNHKFKNTLFSLSKAFNKIASKIVLGVEDIRFHIELFHRPDSPIFVIKEYDKILQIMESDSTIKTHIGKLIGTFGSKRMLSGADLLQAFLKWHFELNPTCNKAVFTECYQAFEKFFHESELISIETCRLFNFECDVPEIQLCKDVKIRRANKRDVSQLDKEFQDSFYIQSYEVFSNSNYVVEKRSKVRKIVLDERQAMEPASSPDEKELRKFKDAIEHSMITFDNVIKLLRLLKPSAIYRDHRVGHKYDGYFGCLARSNRISHLENTVIGAKCRLDHDDVADLRNFWHLHEREKTTVIDIALDRLSFATERRTIADRMLDDFIGLESLYLPDGNQELTFRLSLRVALMLEDSPDKSENTFLFLKEMYDKRSKIAHGKNIKIEQPELDRLEALLRTSIKLFLQDKSKFNEKSLNKIFFNRPSS